MTTQPITADFGNAGNADYPILLTEVRTLLNQLKTRDPGKLARIDELNTLNFQQLVPYATRLIEVYKMINFGVLSLLPQDRLKHVYLEAIKDRDLMDDFETVTFDTLVNNRDPYKNRETAFKDRVGQRVFELTPLVALSHAMAANSRQYEAAFNGVIANVQTTAREQNAEMKATVDAAKAKLEEVASVLADARMRSGAQTASTQAAHFGTLAKKHEDAANRWLWTTCATGVLLLLASIGSVFLHKSDWFTPIGAFEIASVISGKMIVISTLAYAVYFCARNYMSHSHNAIVCRHRENALKTYGAMAHAANDLAQRDVILTKAADSIFGPQPTGYTKADGGEPAAISMIAMAPNALRSATGQQQ